jgi:trehalose 6-phosphate synthase
VNEMEALARRPDVVARSYQLRQALGAPHRVVLAVDRLDYTKGIEHRLTAYDELLHDGRVKVRDTVLVQVAIPSRERLARYRGLRNRIEGEVGRINGEYGRVGEPAVHYLNQSFDRAELAALYRTADVMVVTPLRDGMNLVAKEYVAARADSTGALVLSEFAGAADELAGAFLVNPHDVDDLKETLVRALHADPSDLAARMDSMRAELRAHDIIAWARAYLQALDRSGPGPRRAPSPGAPSPARPDPG